MKIKINFKVACRCYEKINNLNNNRRINTILKEIKQLIESYDYNTGYIELDNKLRNKILKVLKVNDISLYSNISNEEILSNLNEICEECNFINCQFRNKRGILKLQRVNFRNVRCEYEKQQYINNSLQRKLP